MTNLEVTEVAYSMLALTPVIYFTGKVIVLINDLITEQRIAKQISNRNVAEGEKIFRAAAENQERIIDNMLERFNVVHNSINDLRNRTQEAINTLTTQINSKEE